MAIIPLNNASTSSLISWKIRFLRLIIRIFTLFLLKNISKKWRNFLLPLVDPLLNIPRIISFITAVISRLLNFLLLLLIFVLTMLNFLQLNFTGAVITTKPSMWFLVLKFLFLILQLSFLRNQILTTKTS